MRLRIVRFFVVMISPATFGLTSTGAAVCSRRSWSIRTFCSLGRTCDGAVLEPNAYDWGHPPPWRRVPIRVIGNDASREAALLSGDLVERDLLRLQAWSRAE
jgi:hypothetical protein